MFIEHSPFNRWSGQYDSFSLAIYSEFAMFGLLNPGVQGAQDAAYRRVCGEPVMSPHRLFRSPTVRTVPLRSSRPLLHHGRHRCGLGVARLEDRTLLSGPSGDVLAAVAPKIELGTPKTGTLAPGEVVFFQIDPNTDGRLVAQVHAEGATTRLSLLDGQGQVLMQSDGQSPDNRDDLIDLHVPAGTDYLEVENLGGAGAYTLTTTLTPATTPFQPISGGVLAKRPRGGGLQRRRPHRPGRRQLRRQRRVGVAGQRRRHLPGPGDVRGGDSSQTRSWRGTSTATAAPTWPSPTPAPTTCRCCWATATAPSRTR